MIPSTPPFAFIARAGIPQASTAIPSGMAQTGLGTEACQAQVQPHVHTQKDKGRP
jgi:hypothetical protein